MFSTDIPVTVILYSLIIMGFIGFAVQFISLRIRNLKENPPDPQLGRKSLLYFFFNFCIILFLVGLTQSVVELMKVAFDSSIQTMKSRGLQPNFPVPVGSGGTKEWLSDQQRTSLGLMSSGFLQGILIFVAIRLFTNDRMFPTAGRSFAAIRFFLAGFVLIVINTSGIIILFQRESVELEQWITLFAYSFVWWPTVILHCLLLFRSQRNSRSGEGHNPSLKREEIPSIAPPPQPESAKQAESS